MLGSGAGSVSENPVVGPRASGFLEPFYLLVDQGSRCCAAGKDGEAGDVCSIVDAGCHAHARVGMHCRTYGLDSCLRKRKHGTPLEAGSDSPTGS